MPPAETQSHVVRTSQQTRTEGLAVRPDSIAGQSPGALLMVKRAVTGNLAGGNTLIVYPGDLVRIVRPSIDSELGICSFHVEHIASQLFMTVPRLCFLPYSSREICDCPDYSCNCIYKNFQSSLAFHLKRKSKICEFVDTPEGQTVGALLHIAQKPPGASPDGHQFQVGDIIEYIGRHPENPLLIKARNLRTGYTGDLLWESIWNVGPRKLCGCKEKSYACSCLYYDFDRSMKHNAGPRSLESGENPGINSMYG